MAIFRPMTILRVLMIKIISNLFGIVSSSEFLVILTAKMYFLPHQLLTIVKSILSLLSFFYCSQRNAMVEKRTLHSTVLFLFRERIPNTSIPSLTTINQALTSLKPAIRFYVSAFMLCFFIRNRARDTFNNGSVVINLFRLCTKKNFISQTDLPAVKTRHMVSVSNSSTQSSRLLPPGFPEYKITVSKQGEEQSSEPHHLLTPRIYSQYRRNFPKS